MRLFFLLFLLAQCGSALGQESLPLPDDFDPNIYGQYTNIGESLEGDVVSGLRALRSSLFQSEAMWRLKAEEAADRIVQTYFAAQLADRLHAGYSDRYADLLIDGNNSTMGLREFFSQDLGDPEKAQRRVELGNILRMAFKVYWTSIENGEVLAGKETYSGSLWKARKRSFVAGALPLPTLYYSSQLISQLIRTIFVRVPAWWDLGTQGHLYRMNKALKQKHAARECERIMIRLRQKADFEKPLRKFLGRQKFWIPGFLVTGGVASGLLYYNVFEEMHKWDSQEDVYQSRIRPFLKEI